MPLFCWVIIYLTCIVIHHTKPMSVGIHHAKGFWDMLIYKTYTRCLKSYTNFWTPCSTIRINHVIIPLRIPSQKLGLNVLIIPEHHAGPRTTRLLFIA